VSVYAAGRFKVGIHIADVSFFVREGTALDAEAQRRCTSTYLVQKVIPMLPGVLCETLCSLNPGVDRLAYTVECVLNADGSRAADVAPWFGRTVIRSCAKLDYGIVQEMIDGELTLANAAEKFAVRPACQQPRAPHTTAHLIHNSLALNGLAVQMRAARLAQGSISLRRNKLAFVLDADGLPLNYHVYPMRDSNRMVEEFMLLANQLVGEKLAETVGVLALLRKHTGLRYETLYHLLQS
jgi:DIS3-like exonuclease 2